jgi:hypothetical protein
VTGAALVEADSEDEATTKFYEGEGDDEGDEYCKEFGITTIEVVSTTNS